MHIRVRKDIEKNSVIYERGEQGNVGVRHYRLRQNKYQLCPLKFHICQSDTRAIGRHQTHRWSTVLLLVLDQRQLGLLLECVSRPLPSPKYIWFCGLQQSEYRFCFFIANESEDFIHFSFCNFLWNRRVRQRLCLIHHPQRDSLRWNL